MRSVTQFCAGLDWGVRYSPGPPGWGDGDMILDMRYGVGPGPGDEEKGGGRRGVKQEGWI